MKKASTNRDESCNDFSSSNYRGIIKRFFEQQANRGDVSLYKEFLTEDIKLYGPTCGQVITGIPALQNLDYSYYQAYPEATFQLSHVVSFEDEVFVRWSCTGQYHLYQGTLRKKEFSTWGLGLYRFRQNKIYEIQQSWDQLSLLKQVQTPPIKSHVPNCPSMEEQVKQANLLSSRERECLNLLLRGKTAKETGAALKLSQRTVEYYLENIKRKLACLNKGELFSKAETFKQLRLL